jgi:hypothetical protein
LTSSFSFPSVLRTWRFGIPLAVLALLHACDHRPPSTPGKLEQAPTTFTITGPADQHDLARDEEHGGHTLHKHVGRTDVELQERLHRERNISAASTWTDRETAEQVIAEALRAERSRTENWIRRGYPRPNLALHYDAGRVIGRSLQRGDSEVVNCTSAVIVLRADGPDSFFVLTAYPEARE